MSRTASTSLLVALLATGSPAMAAESRDADHPWRITCEYAIVDAPFNVGGWSPASVEWPSTGQAASLTKCVYQLGHKGIQAGLGAVVDRARAPLGPAGLT